MTKCETKVMLTLWPHHLYFLHSLVTLNVWITRLHVPLMNGEEMQLKKAGIHLGWYIKRHPIYHHRLLDTDNRSTTKPVVQLVYSVPSHTVKYGFVFLPNLKDAGYYENLSLFLCIVHILHVTKNTIACVTVLLAWTEKHDSDRSNKDDCLWLKTGCKTGRSVKEANKSKKGQGRESEVRAGRQVRNIL